MIIQGNSKILAIALVLITMTACDANRVYEKNITIPDNIWNKDNVLTFDVDINDTISTHNIYVNIRNASHYQYSNLYLFINTTAPSGASIRDTFECILADESGKWLGSGLGDLWDNQIPFKGNVRFPLSGVYRFDMVQAMRGEKLPFIMDAGLRIEKTEY